MATDSEDKVQVNEDQDDVKSDDSSLPDDTEEEMEVSLENGGIVKKILTKGTGFEKPPVGAECFVHYVGTLEDGTKFDSSRDRGEPFSFKLGQGSVIKAWDKGVATMKKGEKALLICKPEYAYGASGSPPKIPPNATLHFEVELLSFSSMEKVTDDGQVMKKVLEAGDGWKTPKELGKVNAKITGKLKDGTVFYRHDGELDVSDPSLSWGLAEGLLKVKKGQKLLLFVQPEYGYGEIGNKQLGVPPHAELEYEISVVDFTNPKDTWDMSKREKVDHGVRLKECGNALFKTTQYKRAKKLYEAVAKLYEYEKDLEPDIQVAVDKLKVEAHANAAACAYHEKNWTETIKECDSALKVDENHPKSLFRRAQAHGQNGDNDVAIRDLKKLKEVIALKEEKGEAIGVDKAAVEKFAQSIKARIAHVEKKQRKLFGGFFSKLSLVSEEEVKKSQSKAKPMDEDSSDEEPEKTEPPKAESAPAEAAPAEPAPAPVEQQAEPVKEAEPAKEAEPEKEAPAKAKTKDIKGKGTKKPETQGSKKTDQAKKPSKKEAAKADAPVEPAAEEPKKEEPKAKAQADPKSKAKAKEAEAKPKAKEAEAKPKAKEAKAKEAEAKPEPKPEPKAEPAEKTETSEAQDDKPKKKATKTPSKDKAPAPAVQPAKAEEPKEAKVEEPKEAKVEEPKEVKAEAKAAEPAQSGKSPAKGAAGNKQTKTPAKRKQ